MNDKWKPIPGFEGYYEVSDTGFVRSVDRVITRHDGVSRLLKSRTCKLSKNSDGYMQVKLSKNGSSRYFAVHRLVYTSFVGEIPIGYDVDHIDFDRTNNHYTNLQAITHRENVLKTVSAGRNYTSVVDVRGANNPNFGNKKLSKIYENDKAYAKEKQGRPGKKNGRARPVRLYINDIDHIDFDYIRQCAIYIKQRFNLTQKTETIALRLVDLVKNGKPFMSLSLKFI